MEATKMKVRVRDLIRFVVFLFLGPVVLFASAGRLDWWEAWVLIVLMVGAALGSRILANRANPGLLAERASSMDREDAKSWDRVLVPIVALFALALFVVAGLDRRLGWSPEIPLAVRLAALVVVALGYALSSWALIANRFFSGVVRIQKDRGHSVVSGGPYRIVRHPGYAGAVYADLAMPLLLGSLWAFIPAVLTVAGMAVRTALEDRTLQEELDGYRAYTHRVRYRLLPGVW